MKSLSPVETTLIIAGAVSLVGLLIAFFRNRAIFTGYQEVAEEARALRRALSGVILRDGDDLVVNGTFQNWPVVIRFSNAENTAGLNLRMMVPASFAMSVAPTAMQLIDGGRQAVATGDYLFDARFSTRTNHPAQSKLFLTRANLTLVQKLCCSSKTLLSVNQGTLEVSELVTPHDAASHALEHLQVMAQLAVEFRSMPGAEAVKVVPFRRDRHVLGRIAIVAACAVCLASVVAATRASVRAMATSEASGAELPEGMLPLEAQSIPEASNWKLAAMNEFDPVGIYWMRSQGVEPEGRISLDFSGSGTSGDTTFVLVSEKVHRVVVLAQHRNLFDSSFPELTAVARVPQSSVGAISWAGGAGPDEIPGDGLLVVTGQGENASAMVLFVKDSRLLSFVPENYQQINLR
ncbi:MAG: hypothetical protein AB7O65_06655 [Candidatus Korobacteraceae bacterium]